MTTHAATPEKTEITTLVDGLSHLLADTYMLYLKTQQFHWNVIGPNFYSLHKMFEEQYLALAEAADTIAERIRALRAPAPASYSSFLKLTSIEEANDNMDAHDMLQELLNGHELIAKQLSRLFLLAQADHDEVTLDMLITRKSYHDKTAWMLRSSLGLS